MTNHQVQVVEFTPTGERIVASIETSLTTGERYSSAVHIGYYPDDSAPEVFIEQEGNRVQFPAEALPTIIKQLRRAAAGG